MFDPGGDKSNKFLNPLKMQEGPITRSKSKKIQEDILGILKDFWNAALIRKDPLQTIEDMSHGGEEDSGWEDEDIKEESDDGDDEDEDNKEFRCK